MPNKQELERSRAERAYWKQYARLFPQHRLSEWRGNEFALLMPLVRGAPAVQLTAEIAAAIDAARNEGVARAEAQSKAKL